MEKYAEIIKAMSECAGPDCGVTCPYKDRSSYGTKSCRSMLLEDAMRALAEEETAAHNLREEVKNLHADLDDLEAATNTLRAERDALRAETTKLKQECTCILQRESETAAHLHVVKEQNKSLCEERDALRDEVAELAEALEVAEDKTDRPSVGFEELAEKIGEMVALAKYQEGRADALAAIVERCSFGGGGRHE